MQEHDLTFVRAEMALAQKPPRSARPASSRWLQTNLFSTIPDTILTIFGLLLAVCDRPAAGPLGLRQCAVDRHRSQLLRDVAQGGIQPDGWSGACWAFVTAKFEQFMYRPLSYRRSAGASILTAVLFVALLVPLMIPRVPYKALNAIVFFGVFPVVGFILLIGAALPFRPGRPDCADRRRRDLAGRRRAGPDRRHPGHRSQRHRQDRPASSGCRTRFGAFFAAARIGIHGASYYAALPFDRVAATSTACRGATESLLGGRSRRCGSISACRRSPCSA